MKSASKHSPFVPRSVLAITCAVLATACQTVTERTPSVSKAESQRQLSDSQALMRRYEARYGKLLPKRPKHNFRELRAQLKGKPMSAVTALLGKPAAVFSSDSTESWDYMNAAYDPVSGRTVRRLEIWFRSGVVDYLTSSF